METVRKTFALALVTVLLLAAPAILPAAEPEQLSSRPFEVTVSGGGSPMVEVSFTLALSEVSSYPVTITAIGGDGVEEQLWAGSLSEGVYRLRAPLQKISAGPLKVILKTAVVNRSAQGNQSFSTYLKWEGTISR